MTEPATWEEGPWIVELKHVYRCHGMTSDDAVRMARMYCRNDEAGLDRSGHELSQVEPLNSISSVYPDGAEPFDPDIFREDQL